jgi:Tfp pilus assembly protein PilF
LEDGRVCRGAFYFREGDFEAARADYEWAIERSPLNGLLYFERAHIYELLGRKDEAESDRKKGRELIADIDPEPHERKLAEIQAWLQENPSNPSLYWYRGECYQVLGREDEANADRRRAMDLHAEARRQKEAERRAESRAEQEEPKCCGNAIP